MCPPSLSARFCSGPAGAGNRRKVDYSYRSLAQVLDEVKKISGTGSTKEKLSHITKYLEGLREGSQSGTQLRAAAKLILGRLQADKTGFKLNVGDAAIKAAVLQLNESATEDQVTNLMQNGTSEDLGEALGDFFDMHAEKDYITLQEVVDNLIMLGGCSGKGAVQQRIDLLKQIFKRSGPMEIPYLVRMLQGKPPRIGISELRFFDALANALNKSAEDVRRQWANNPDIDMLIQGLLSKRKSGHIEVHSPIRPMAPSPMKSIEKVWENIQGGDWTAEWKHDGERLQIHASKAGITIWSRNLKNVTQKYPDVKTLVEKSLRKSVSSVIIDAEVVAVEEREKQWKLLPFQELSKRKMQVSEDEISIKVSVYIFDCLMLNGKCKMDEDLHTRRGCLTKAFNFTERLRQVEITDITRKEILTNALADSIAGGTEGLIVKDLAAQYVPNKRTRRWWKLKKDYLESSLSDAVDAVVVGVWYGEGKNVGKFSSFLLAVRNENDERLETFVSVGTGLTKSQIGNITQQFFGKLTDKQDGPPPDVTCGNKRPDRWIERESRQVWEVLGADLSVSPEYACSKSLRFPRLLRVRDPSEKDASTASTTTDILHLTIPR